MTATAQFPRTQHWTINRFRISVLLYKRNGYWEPCATCGAKPAIHCVMATGRGDREGFHGGPARFCDEHRPARGTLPPLEYTRLVRGLDLLGHGGNMIVHEHLEPRPEYPCADCGEPGLFEIRERCTGCTDARYLGSVQRIEIRPGGTTEHPPERTHTPHDLGEWWACASHAPPIKDAP